ncbi:MAG: biotin/lipoyl-binding protein [Verrucomicrobia bacterium]|jgi:glutaconyl-CoA/methylmalonyl-CoA decarboxylase subunit gamma|nr:biotin/lipoyl-binding protein [Verrucomicrobiota bacterium]
MKKLRVTVEGKSYDVTVELLGEGSVTPAPLPAPTLPVSSSPSSGSGDAVPSPLAGKVVSIDVKAGQQVSEGDELMILEAMKMNTHVFSPASGTIGSILVQAGDNVEEGQSLATIA